MTRNRRSGGMPRRASSSANLPASISFKTCRMRRLSHESGHTSKPVCHKAIRHALAAPTRARISLAPELGEAVDAQFADGERPKNSSECRYSSEVSAPRYMPSISDSRARKAF